MSDEREEISVLLDIYGSLLTDNQREAVDYYYNDDLSLAEIAENCGITRQGVRDTIQRAKKQLVSYDEALGLSKYYAEMTGYMKEILALSEEIKSVNLETALSREINDAATRINTIALMALE